MRERKQNLTLRMEPSNVREIKAVADDLGVPYQTLLRMWIIEQLRRQRAGSEAVASPGPESRRSHGR